MPEHPRFQATVPRAVEVMVFPAVQLLDVAGPLQVFASANDLASAAGRSPPYTLRVVSSQPGAGTVLSSSGLAFEAGPPLQGERQVGSRVDTLVVPGGRGIPEASSDLGAINWIRERAAVARRVVSVCTGAFLLGAAGLLDGRRAVTHWSFCDQLARRHPAIRVEPDPIFIRDGNIWTSAGVSAGIDLALALVEEDLGRATALAIARYLVVFLKRPGGQGQFSAALSLHSSEEEFDALHAWIASHLSDDLSLPVLARKARMSERSFSRRYATAHGVTPSRTVARLRVEAACNLIAEGSTSMKRIAVRCGFRSEETMRLTFRRLVGATPREYRARFGR